MGQDPEDHKSYEASLFSLDSLVPIEELKLLLKNLGDACESCCAIVRHPTPGEGALLRHYETYLQPGAKPPSPATLEKMREELHTLTGGEFQEIPADYSRNAANAEREALIQPKSRDISYGRRGFCDLLRKSPLLDLRCYYCNYLRSSEAFRKREGVDYLCHAGLADMVAPIVVGNVHVADLFLGQNYSPINEERLKQLFKISGLETTHDIAFEHLLDEYNILQREAPKANAKRLKRYKGLLFDLANSLSMQATAAASTRTFSEMWRQAHAATDLRAMLKKAMGTARHLVCYDSASVWIRDPDRKGWLKCLFSDYGEDHPEVYQHGLHETEGLGGKAMQATSTFVLPSRAKVADVPVPEAYRKIRQARDLGTFLGTPIRSGKEQRGFVEFGSHTEDAFWPGTISIAEDIARYVGLFLQFKTDFAAVLADMVNDGSPRYLPDLFVQHIRETFGALACSIFSYTHDRKQLVCDATTGIANAQERSDVRYNVSDTSLTSYVFRTGESVRVGSRRDLPAHIRHAGVADPLFPEALCDPHTGQSLTHDPQDVSALIVPMKGQDGRVVGVLRIVGKLTGDFFNEDEQRLAERISTALGHSSFPPYKLLSILRTCAAMMAAPDEPTLLFQFLTTITHGEGIGINRAILFEHDSSEHLLTRVLAVGPLDAKAAREHASTVAKATPSLSSCIDSVTDRLRILREAPLQRAISERIDLTSAPSLEATINSSNELQTDLVLPEAAERELSDQLPKLDLTRPSYAAFRLGPERTFLLLCDNINTLVEVKEAQRALVATVIAVVRRSLETMGNERREIRVRREWWMRAISIAAHNLGNKLPFIEDCLQSALDNYGKPEAEQDLQLACDRLRVAVRDVRDLRRMDVPVAPDQLVSASKLLGLVQCGLQAGKRLSIDVECKPWDGPAVTIKADIERILDAFDALLQNVYELGLDHPRASVVGEILQRDDLPRGLMVRKKSIERYLRITFADNGPGISKERKTQIFAPYLTTKPRGMGMGLPFVARVFEGHGGFVQEIGQTGKEGAKFQLYLPIDSDKAPSEAQSADLERYQSRPASPKAPSNRPALTFIQTREEGVQTSDFLDLLLVEDDEFVASRILTRFESFRFGQWRIRAARARSMLEYLQLQRKKCYHVAIVDNALLREDDKYRGREQDKAGGVNVSDHLRIWNSGIVTVLYSANFTTEECVQVMRYGAWDCIDKNARSSLVKLLKSVEEGLKAKMGGADWVQGVIEDLPVEYAGHYVAVLGGKVVEHNASLSHLEELMRQRDPSQHPVYVQVPEIAPQMEH